MRAAALSRLPAVARPADSTLDSPDADSPVIQTINSPVEKRVLMELIVSTDVLAAFCERAAGFDFVTVDTEFLRETTYWPKLCLLQAATEDEAVLIDPLAAGLDLAPFFELLANDKVRKVFHAARQDIEIFVKADRQGAAQHLRHPGRCLGLRLRRQRLLRQPGALDHQGRTRQVLALHRLVGPPAHRKAEASTRSPTSPICATSTRRCSSRSTTPAAGTGSRTNSPCSNPSTPMWCSPSMPGSGSRPSSTSRATSPPSRRSPPGASAAPRTPTSRAAASSRTTR